MSDRADDDDSPGDGRDETRSERLDRNWHEILQELRVIQTGTQILTGFLLTLAFQPRFADLDQVQVDIYLVLVVLAASTTALGLAPVSLHRTLFRRQAKSGLVTATNRMLQITLAGVCLVLTGTLTLIFDVVLSRTAGVIAGSGCLVVVLALWVVFPAVVRRNQAGGPPMRGDESRG